MPKISPSKADFLERTQQLYQKVRHVIPAIEWATFAEDIDVIMRLKKERNAVILAHNYMRPEIYHGIADIRGDSLALAREAAKIDAEVIVMAGVHFMAETAKLMNPTRTVLIPDLKAGCSLASSITAQDVRTLKKRYPGLPVVTYVNTSAEVKAESDICCTSSNARQVIESLKVPAVIMIPDRYLAQNVAQETKVTIYSWEGACEVHERFTAQEIKEFREQTPGVVVLAHPECPPDVVQQADYSGSTKGLIDWIDTHRPPNAVLLTECSMSDNVAVNYPDINFIRPCQMCPHMKKITLANIRSALENMQYEVTIAPEVAERARTAVERMVALG